MDRIGTFLILMVAALVLVPGSFAEEVQSNETTSAIVTEVVVSDINGTSNGTVVEEVKEVVLPDFEANMTVNTLEKVGINQTVAISLTAAEEGIWNTTTTEGLEQVGEPVTTNGTEVFTIKAIGAGEQLFNAAFEAANATEANETYSLAIIVA